MVMLVAVAMATWEQLRATCCPKLPALDATNVSYNCFRCGRGCPGRSVTVCASPRQFGWHSSYQGARVPPHSVLPSRRGGGDASKLQLTNPPTSILAPHLLPNSLSSFAMSLLLAFRLRSCYDRWWQARCGFTGVGGAGEQREAPEPAVNVATGGARLLLPLLARGVHDPASATHEDAA